VTTNICLATVVTDKNSKEADHAINMVNGTRKNERTEMATWNENRLLVLGFLKETNTKKKVFF
jgi:hypothetical protein